MDGRVEHGRVGVDVGVHDPRRGCRAVEPVDRGDPAVAYPDVRAYGRAAGTVQHLAPGQHQIEHRLRL